MLAQMTARLRAQDTFESCVQTMLDDVVALHGAEFGDIQLPIGDEIVLVAQRNLPAHFLQTFRRVSKDDGCVCGRALRLRDSIVVPDIERDEHFAPFVMEARTTGFRSVQSTPMFAQDGSFMGMISTLFANPHTPSAIEMATLKSYVSMAAAHLSELLGTARLEEKASQMNVTLYAASDRGGGSQVLHRRFKKIIPGKKPRTPRADRRKPR